eukprot:TRINITY_DN1231_c0_g1_i1.p1 TRINITY_DN1231_c0_g1~~TRINITY_DN1231_c0_g1_i1.p1  ORF type:complete len:550 (+),score=75.89 TRINITY_DN1231_c0_g1_i1:495-2144(+)
MQLMLEQKPHRLLLFEYIRMYLPFLSATSTNGCVKLGYDSTQRASEVLSLLSDEDAFKVFRLQSAQLSIVDSQLCTTLSPDDDRSHRAKVHALLRRAFPTLSAETVTTDAGSCIRVTKAYVPPSMRSKRKRAAVAAAAIPEDCRYIRFVLRKRNRETAEAISCLSQYANLSPSAFQVAGTKDRRGVTSQFVTVSTVLAGCETLLLAAQRAGLEVGNFSYVRTPYSLGMLRGNRFSVVVRNIACGEVSQMQHRMDLWVQKGFVNYFGMQRFGALRGYGAADVGRAMLQQKWHEALRMMLAPCDSSEDPQRRRAFDIFTSTQDVRATLLHLPQYMTLQRRILCALRDSAGDEQGRYSEAQYANAICNTGKRMEFYVHAYQSLVWNLAVTERFRQYGSSPVVGDLISEDAMSNDGDESMLQEDCLESAVCDEPPTKSNRNVSDVRFLTDADSAMSIFDVVLPLPGTAVEYPKHSVAEFMQAVLVNDGIDLAAWAEQFPWRVSGGYRRIAAVPIDPSWSVQHDDTGASLTIKFELRKSQFATMCLRELLRVPC